MNINDFDPNDVGLRNGNFIGLPFDEENSKIILLPVPWDVTVSYNDGTSTGPANILQESVQLDLHDIDIDNAWQSGIYFAEIDDEILKILKNIRNWKALYEFQILTIFDDLYGRTWRICKVAMWNKCGWSVWQKSRFT